MVLRMYGADEVDRRAVPGDYGIVEQLAVRSGAGICGQPLRLAWALEKLESSAKHIDNVTAEDNPAMAHLFIVNPLYARFMDSLFSTHPNTANRVRKLREMAARGGQSGPWG